MKVLVVYDTVSPMKVTKSVAETIVVVLKEKGADVDSYFVNDVDKATVKNYDSLIAGGPTMAFRASRGIMAFLNSLQKETFSGKSAAAFDTQTQSRLSGNATKGIESKLKNLGFKIIVPPLVTFVEGGMNQWRLKAGEVEKIMNWGEELAKMLSR